MSLIIAVPAVNEPVSVAEVKALIRLDSSADDAMVARLITAAREFAEKVTRRALVYKGYVLYMDTFPSPGLPIRVPVPPLISVSSILYLDSSLASQTWDPAEYFIANKQEPGLIVPKPNFVYPSAQVMPGGVEVHFTAGHYSDGYGDATRPIPEHLRLAIMQLAGHWYDHPEAFSPDTQNGVPVNLLTLFRSNQIYVF